MPGADGGARRPASPSGGAAAPLAAALGALAGGLVFLAPRLERLGGAARRLPAAYASLLLGAALLFFGGAYRATIAAVEAWRLTADEAVKKAFGTIWRNVQRAAAASEADDNVDADGDGVADVRQVSSEQLLRRKARLLLASVEPGEVATAAGVAWAGLLAVVTTVKARSAQTVALGSYLGTQAHGLVGAPLERTVKHALPEDQEKWARPLAKAVTGFVGVLVGWRLSSLIFAATASVRGANLALDGALALAGGLAPHLDASMRQLAVYVIAACGFYWQLSLGFGVPFLLQLPLLPLSMLDSAIVFLVAMV